MAATIDKLPEKMLVEVLEYLDAKTVKEAALVCKKWNRVISTEPKIMKKFVLINKCDKAPMTVDEFKELMSLKRHYSQADLFWCDKECILLQVCERFGKRLSHLNLRHSYLTAETALEVLENMPELEELRLVTPHSEEFSEVPPGSVTMKKLKKLHVYGSWDFPNMLKAPMLSYFDAQGLNGDSSSKVIDKLLKTSPKLETLKIEDISIMKSHSFLFQLKHIEIFKPFKLTKNVEKFFRSQAATLETIETIKCCEDSKFLEIILTKCKRLRSIKTGFAALQNSVDFCINMKPLPLLKKIIADDEFSSKDVMRAVLRNCPELETLQTWEDLEDGDLEFIANNNKKLKFLSLFFFEPNQAKFQKLQTLELQEIRNEDYFGLIRFLEANPTIENLTILDLAEKSNEMTDCELAAVFKSLANLVKVPSLKRVKIEGEDWLMYVACSDMKRRFTPYEIQLEMPSDYNHVIITKEAQTV